MEASNMAKKLQIVRDYTSKIECFPLLTDLAALLQIVDQANRGEANPQLKGKIRIVKGKIEDYHGPRVDTLISEPIGLPMAREND